ncbi:MAG: IS91 family transposase [Xanthobacteraceae bacterium]|nr:IS91 family transposase [Xanthobacteraceae bacterium]
MRRPRPGPARFDIADIVRAHRAALEAEHRLTPSQKRMLTDIAQCRTAALGGHIDRCLSCGHEHPAYNSCRDRHCPKCQALAQEKWIMLRRQHMLDVPHFHVVFTLPSELRPLARFARRLVYRALMHCAQRTLAAFARRRLGATMGVTSVLHTWTRKLEYHPHVHAIVTGGGLRIDGAGWKPVPPRFLFPVAAMARVFRGKMMATLGEAYGQGAFAGFGDFRDPQGFERLMARLAKLSWHVYVKTPFRKGQHVLDYLGRYTHRVGIANSRLLDVRSDAVTFRTKGRGTETLSPIAFLRRLVAHVLPHRLHKIRHAGLYAPAAARRLQTARAHLRHATLSPPQALCWRQWLARVTGRDVTRCSRCGAPTISVPVARCRDPPTLAA